MVAFLTDNLWILHCIVINEGINEHKPLKHLLKEYYVLGITDPRCLNWDITTKPQGQGPYNS